MRFEIRLESPSLTHGDGTPCFRVTRLDAENEDAARAFCRRREFRTCTFQIQAAELADLKAKQKNGTLAGTDKARLFAHQQDEPYEIVSVTRLDKNGQAKE